MWLHEQVDGTNAHRSLNHLKTSIKDSQTLILNAPAIIFDGLFNRVVLIGEPH